MKTEKYSKLIIILTTIILIVQIPVSATGPVYNGGIEFLIAVDVFVDFNESFRGAGWYDATHVKTIQEGIDNASSDDTVFVYNGSYDENININKPLTLIGQKNSTGSSWNYATYIDTDPGGATPVVLITSNWVNLTNFDIRSQKYSCPCVGIQNRQHINVSNCIITTYPTIDSAIGISLDTSSSCNIFNNGIYGIGNRGIYLDSSHHCNITNNTITTSGSGIGEGTGIRSMSSNYITYERNLIYGNRGSGLYLKSSSNNTVQNNTFMENSDTEGASIAIVDGSHDNLIGTSTPLLHYSNIIQNNTCGMCLTSNCRNNTISMNLFTENVLAFDVVTASPPYSAMGENDRSNLVFRNDFKNSLNKHIQVFNSIDDGFMYWNLSYPADLKHAIGNYYDDYGGADDFHGPYQNLLGRDGVGDTPYTINETYGPAGEFEPQTSFVAYYASLFTGGNISYDLYPICAENEEASSADLWGGYESTDPGDVGFYYGECNNCTQAINTFNVTAGTGLVNESFSRHVDNLNNSSCYCFRVWASNSTGFHAPAITRYFFTKPSGPPSNFRITSANATNISLAWTNLSITPPFCAISFLQQTIIRYSDSSHPMHPTDGTLGYIGTAEHCKISNLSVDQEYFFSAWTYIIVNCSGYTFFQNSSEFADASTWTQGGAYNITVRYENTTYGLVDLTKYCPHRIIIYYFGEEPWGEVYGEVDYITICTNVTGHTEVTMDAGVLMNTTQLANGSFVVTVNRTIKFIEFHWNDSIPGYLSNYYRCSRIIAPDIGQRNVTFFIRTNMLVWGEGTNNKNGSLVKYDYSFIDETGKFRRPNAPKCYIYTFDNEGNKLIIHEEYFDGEGHIHPWLVYGKTYFLGVTCTYLTYDRLCLAPAKDDTVPEINIPYSYKQNYTFDELIILDVDWYSNGFYAFYRDTTYSTTMVTFQVFDIFNQTELYNTTYVGGSIKNFTYPCATNQSYLYKITALLDSPDDVYDGTYTTGLEPILAIGDIIISPDTLDNIVNIILGPTPIYDSSRGVEVPWTYIIIFSLSFMFLCTLGKLNAFVGALGTGLTLALSGFAILGFNNLFANYEWWQGPSLIIVGIFVVAIGIVGLVGGVDRGGGFY